MPEHFIVNIKNLEITWTEINLDIYYLAQGIPTCDWKAEIEMEE